MFSDMEIAFIRSQKLARIATCSREFQPDVAPVGFEFEGRYFYVGGIKMRDTLKYKNAVANSKVALVIDDFESVDPPKPRGIKLHGKAEVVERSGYAGAGIYLKILPEIVWSWGIEAPALQGGNPVIKKMRFG